MFSGTSGPGPIVKRDEVMPSEFSRSKPALVCSDRQGSNQGVAAVIITMGEVHKGSNATD